MRVWVTSAVVVAIAVGAVLYFTDDPPADANGGRTLRPPAALSEKEVRDYIKIRQREHLIMIEAAKALQPARDKLATMLRTFKHSHASWGTLRQRVEYIVDAVRWDEEKPDRDRRREEKIEELKAQLKTVNEDPNASDALKEQLKKQLDYVISTRGDKGYPVLAEDKELARRFWADLNQLAPKQNPKPEKTGG